MAQFYQDPNPTNDPNYQGSSREPDRQQSDQSWGKLFEGIGNVTDLAGKTIKQGFTDAIKRDARTEVEGIMRTQGGDLSTEDIKAIAGTGAKGKVRLQQMRAGAGSYDPAAVGESTEALGYAPVDAARDAAVNEIFKPFDQNAKPLPEAATRELNGLSRYTQAYRAGNLSDSYVYGQFNQVVAKLKARYQGWEDEIDKAVEGLTGVQPANALRRALLSDIQANEAAKLGSASSEDKWWEKNAASYYAATGQKPKTMPLEQAQAEVARWEGTQKINHSKVLGAQVGSEEAEAAVSGVVAEMARSDMAQWRGGVQGDTFAEDFRKKAEAMTLKGGGTQKEIDELAVSLETRKQRALENARTTLYKPIPDDPQGRNMVTKLGKGGDTRVGEILTAQIAKPYDDMIALVKSKNFSALERMTAGLKEQDTVDQIVFRRAFPKARVATAVNNSFPNNPALVNQYLDASDILPEFRKSVTEIGNAILGGTSATPAPTPSQAIEGYGPLGAGKATTEEQAAKQRALYRQTVKQYDMVTSAENKNTENAAHVAKQFFKDRDFYEKMDKNARLKLFMTMVTPEKAAFLNQISSKDPEVRDLYRSWATYAASDIWRRSSADLQALLETKAYDIQYNEKGNYFYDNTKYAGAGSYQAAQKTPEGITRTINSVNNVIALMKPVTGNDPQSLVTALGIDPKAEKQDLFFKRMWDKLHTKIDEWNTAAEREAILEGSTKNPR